MSSVVSFEKCPVCGQEEALYSDFNVRTQEEKCFCQICGLQLEYYIPRDEEGKAIQPITMKEKAVHHAGVINVKYKGNEMTQMLSIPQGSSEEKAKEKIEEIKRDFDVEEIYATWFNEDTKEVKRIA